MSNLLWFASQHTKYMYVLSVLGPTNVIYCID